MTTTQITVTDRLVPGGPGQPDIPVRHYEPELPAGTLVWAHGGSFVRGTLDWPESDWVARRIAEAGTRVIAVDYRLASEAVRAPAPAEDVSAVLSWAGAEFGAPLSIGGASAGGQLAVHAALAQADAAQLSAAPKPEALLLLYPTLHEQQRADAEIAALVRELPEARRFRPDRISAMYEDYLGPVTGPERQARIAGELPRERLAQLPRTTIVTAEADELRASAEQFAEQLSAAGVPVRATIEPGTVHGYLNRPEASPEAERQARATIDRFLSALPGSAHP